MRSGCFGGALRPLPQYLLSGFRHGPYVCCLGSVGATAMLHLLLLLLFCVKAATPLPAFANCVQVAIVTSQPCALRWCKPFPCTRAHLPSTPPGATPSSTGPLPTMPPALPATKPRPQPPPDIVLALHACDTATDDALALAVKQVRPGHEGRLARARARALYAGRGVAHVMSELGRSRPLLPMQLCPECFLNSIACPQVRNQTTVQTVRVAPLRTSP